MMGLRRWLSIVLCLGVIFIAVPKTFAGEIDILVDKLVEKGILSRTEADEILTETRAEVKREIAEAKHPTLPKWIQKTKVKGDFRLRYQWEKRKGSTPRDRGRIRYRLGLETQVVDQVKVGAGLASGSSGVDSHRSTNQTFQDTFSTPELNLDYAYVEYGPVKWATLIGGKFERKKYLWEPGDLLWDTDINPEGGSIQLRHKLGENAKIYANAGTWVLDEVSGGSDPYMWYVQPGIKATNKDLGVDAHLAVTYYGMQDLKGHTLDGAEGTNTTDANGLFYNFSVVSVGTEVGLLEPFDLPVPRVAVFGEYVRNSNPDDNNVGWLAGIKFGDKKVKDKNQWQLKYMFAYLGKDAFPDALPDADRYSGKTDVRGHETIVQYGLNKNVIFELDYYHNNRINAASAPENIFQSSAIFKF